ncbi:hypothetical protein WH47_08518 [Habropoda laboriosa]|uniref:Uncharacterized protein n=1 Tax=Habropoda laboriosa TaxID=597456 RepID=A0A0L7QP70_9HYME|nr:hypothetical protein WH47_08518 [Habropoda laboriosa]
MHGLRRRNAPTSVDLERNDAPYVRPYVRLFELRDEGAVRNSTKRTRSPPFSFAPSLLLLLPRLSFLPLALSGVRQPCVQTVCARTYARGYVIRRRARGRRSDR